ncbi:hypothetical protein V3C99_000619 [Haemonchus contortus]
MWAYVPATPPYPASQPTPPPSTPSAQMAPLPSLPIVIQVTGPAGQGVPAVSAERAARGTNPLFRGVGVYRGRGTRRARRGRRAALKIELSKVRLTPAQLMARLDETAQPRARREEQDRPME